MKVSKNDQRKRRKEVAKLLDKGLTPYQISKQLNSAETTIKKDINHITAIRSKLLLNNPALAEKHIRAIMKLKREIERVKDEYWELFDNLKKKAEGDNPPKNATYTKVTILRAIVDRIEKEVRILNSFNPKNLIINNNISIGDAKKILNATKAIIDNFVPEQYRNEARQIMMNLDIGARNGEAIIDAEVADE